MNEADRKAFDEAFEKAPENIKEQLNSYGMGWVHALAHRDKQAGEPVASIYITASGEREFDDWRHELPVGVNILYTTPQEAQVNEQMLEALERLVEIENGPIMWEVAGWAEAAMSAVDAIAAAKAARGSDEQ